MQRLVEWRSALACTLDRRVRGSTASDRLERAARLLQFTLIAGLAVWTLVLHTAVIRETGYSAWRLGGFAMYAEPSQRLTAVLVVPCAATCDAAVAEANRVPQSPRHQLTFVSRAGVAEAVPLRSRRDHQLGTLMLVFPSEENARLLSVHFFPDSCSEACVVAHHRQRINLVRNAMVVDTRVFTVGDAGP